MRIHNVNIHLDSIEFSMKIRQCSILVCLRCALLQYMHCRHCIAFQREMLHAQYIHGEIGNAVCVCYLIIEMKN